MAVQYLMMAIWAGAIAIIPILWYVVGIKTYGNGDYYQP